MARVAIAPLEQLPEILGAPDAGDLAIAADRLAIGDWGVKHAVLGIAFLAGTAWMAAIVYR